MIRVTCPKCQKKLGLEDAAAGMVVACPVCKHKFRAPKGNASPATEEPVEIARKVDSKRVPVVRSEANELPVADVVSVEPESVPVASIKPAGKDAAGGPAARPPEIPASSPDSSVQTYGVTVDPEPPPKPKKRRKPDDEDEEIDEADVGLSEEYLKRRKQKKQKAERGRLIAGTSNFALIAGLVAFFGAALAGLAFIKPQLAIVLLILGYLVAFGAGIWLLVEAFMEHIAWGICCLIVPFAALVFVATHWERGRKPFLLNLLGMLLVGAGIGIGIAKNPPHATGGPVAPPVSARPAGPGVP